MTVESRVSELAVRTAQEFVTRGPLYAEFSLNAGTVIWDLDGSPAGENVFFERTWDNFTSTSPLITQVGNGLTINNSLAGRLAMIGAVVTVDIAINNRLTGVGQIRNGATVLATGANYMVRSNANDEGSLIVMPRPYVIQGGETLTFFNRYSQDGTSAVANPALEGGNYFYIYLMGGDA